MIYKAPTSTSRQQFYGFQSPPYLKHLSPDLDQPTTTENSNILRFQYPSLKEYLQDTDSLSIQDQRQAKIKIFTTLSDMLCNGKVTKTDNINSLHKYAAVYFIDHLEDIPGEAKANKEAYLRIRKALHQVLEDHNKASRVFKKVISKANGNIEMLSLY